MKTNGTRSERSYYAEQCFVDKNATRRSDENLVAEYLAKGGEVRRCLDGKYSAEKLKGSAIVGPTTNGRQELWGGRRAIYSR